VKHSRLKRDCFVAALLAMTFLFSGCALFGTSVRQRKSEAEVEQLKAQLSKIQQDQAREIARLMEESRKAARKAIQKKTSESNDLLDAQQRLAESLKRELGDARAKLAMTERGLVLTFLDEIFFDSGKAVVKPDGMETLQKVAAVLKETVPDLSVAVEGHTDNEPILRSGWQSNWELSFARAMAVVRYFADQQGVPPKRLQAVAFGEYHPVASNETPQGRRQNRRVEVVILPKVLKKVKS